MKDRNDSSAASADWYPDPVGRHQYRYWDGASWTHHVADDGKASVDPLAQAPGTVASTTAAVAGHDSKPSNKSAHVQEPQGQNARESMLREEAIVSETIDLAPGMPMVFVKVPAGDFLMGSDPHVDRNYRPNETPQQTVHVDEFWIGKYPVTNEQYWAFDPDRRERGNWDEGRRDMERLPKRYMSLSDAKKFCEWASAQTDRVIRIPTEAEWEKAARGTNGRIWPWGNSPPNSTLCNFSGTGLRETSPVGAFSPQGDSPYGCADMAGNVFELTDGEYIRGGYHSFAENMVRCALRWQDADSATGFRVVTEGLSAHAQKPQGRDARESMLREEADASDSETPWRTQPAAEAEVAGALSRLAFEGGEKSFLDVHADRSRGLFVGFSVVCARSEILGRLPGNGLLSEGDAIGDGAIGDLLQRGWSLDSDGYFFEKRWDLGDEEVTVEGMAREGLEALGGAYGVEAAAPLDMELNLGTDGGSTTLAPAEPVPPCPAQVGEDDRVQVLIQELARAIGPGLDTSAVARVREIGEELNRIGGMSLMIDASMKASEINPRARGFLGKWWDGVGDWVD